MRYVTHARKKKLNMIPPTISETSPDSADSKHVASSGRGGFLPEGLGAEGYFEGSDVLPSDRLDFKGGDANTGADGPLRPKNAFVLYCLTHRASLKKTYPEVSS